MFASPCDAQHDQGRSHASQQNLLQHTAIHLQSDACSMCNMMPEGHQCHDIICLSAQIPLPRSHDNMRGDVEGMLQHLFHLESLHRKQHTLMRVSIHPHVCSHTAQDILHLSCKHARRVYRTKSLQLRVLAVLCKS